MIKDKYPLPLPEEIFDRLGNAKVFIKIDLKSGLEMCASRNFVGTGMERNAFPFKKDLSLSSFFHFFSFLERVFPLFPIFLWISNPVFRHSFPIFSSFHLCKPVPCFLMGLNLAI